MRASSGVNFSKLFEVYTQSLFKSEILSVSFWLNLFLGCINFVKTFQELFNLHENEELGCFFSKLEVVTRKPRHNLYLKWQNIRFNQSSFVSGYQVKKNFLHKRTENLFCLFSVYPKTFIKLYSTLVVLFEDQSAHGLNWIHSLNCLVHVDSLKYFIHLVIIKQNKHWVFSFFK